MTGGYQDSHGNYSNSKQSPQNHALLDLLGGKESQEHMSNRSRIGGAGNNEMNRGPSPQF
jgi:hypothetical protein